MPISMGVLCERCRTVYFISSSKTSAQVTYNRARGEFKVACGPPCNAVTNFQKDMLKAYAATVETLKRGYVDIRECQPLGLERGADHATRLAGTSAD
jgi:hypothetical protein